MKQVPVNETSAAQDPSYTVNSVRRALDILAVFAERSNWTVTEISRHLNLNKTTTFRLVSTLAEAGFLQRNSDDSYRLGGQIASLANETLMYEQLSWKAAPPLQRLSERTGETVHIGVVHDFQMVNVQIVEGTHVLRMHAQIGNRRPAHASALGKMILAHAPNEHVEDYLWTVGLNPYTKNTITDPKVFREHLHEARERGWVIDNEELEPGLRCIAAPVRDNHGHVFAAVSVSGPAFRMTDARLLELQPQVVSTSVIISRLMGFRT